METPFRFEPDTSASTCGAAASQDTTGNWRERLPELSGDGVGLRQLRSADAASLFALLSTEQVARFISTPPDSVGAFARFVAWTHRQRTAGAYACFAVTVEGSDTAVGIFQIRQLERSFETAEWGFAIGAPFWGTGVFAEAAKLALGFAFDVLGARRIEARAAVENRRGTRALLKLGALHEAVLHKSLHLNGQSVDQGLYAILHDDWQSRPQPTRSRAQVPVH